MSKKQKNAKSQKESPTFLSGRFQFEDQYRQVLIKVGTKLLHVVYLSDTGVRCMIAPKNELRYLTDFVDTDSDLFKLKRHAKYLRKKSPVSGLKREMTKKARGVLDEILDL